MGMSMDPSGFIRSITEIQQRKIFAIGKYATLAARKLETTAKKEAPWTDRTAMARRGIVGRVHNDGSRIIITLSGSVEYMAYLELARNKRYAILWPTMYKLKPEILRNMAKIGGNT